MNRGALGWAAADLRRRWPGLVVVAFIAGLGAAVVMVAVIGARRTESALPRALAATRTADVTVSTDVNTDPAAIDAALDAPQVADGARALLYVGGTEGVGVDLSGLVGGEGYGTTFERIVLERGRLAHPTATHEVVLPPATAKEIGVTVGDSFLYDTLSPQQLEGFVTGQPPDESVGPGPSIELTVVGIGATVPELVDATPGVFYATAAFDAAYSDEAGHLGDELLGLARVRLAGGAVDLDPYVAAVLSSPGADRIGSGGSLPMQCSVVEMALNLKNDEAEKLSRELAALTGESITAAVTVAVRERLERVRDTQMTTEQRAERIRQLGRQIAARMPAHAMRVEDLYGEDGLPV